VAKWQNDDDDETGHEFVHFQFGSIKKVNKEVSRYMRIKKVNKEISRYMRFELYGLLCFHFFIFFYPKNVERLLKVVDFERNVNELKLKNSKRREKKDERAREKKKERKKKE